MTYYSNNSSSTKPSNKKCFKCNAEIYFTSKQTKTPSGRPTTDPSTGKVIPLDLFTQEYHECNPEHIETFKKTDEYKKRIAEWLSGHGNNHTGLIPDTAANCNTTNSMKPILEKILASLEQIERVLGLTHRDTEADIPAIKNMMQRENQGKERSPQIESEAASSD